MPSAELLSNDLSRGIYVAIGLCNIDFIVYIITGVLFPVLCLIAYAWWHKIPCVLPELFFKPSPDNDYCLMSMQRLRLSF